MLLLLFAARDAKKPPARLTIDDLDAARVGAFLDHLDNDRHNSTATRNARLAAIHSFYRYALPLAPDRANPISQVLAIPQRRCDRAVVSYLTSEETEHDRQVCLDGGAFVVVDRPGGEITTLPTLRAFMAAHQLEDVTVVADAGMISTANQKAIEEAGLSFILGAKTPTVPYVISEWLRDHPDSEVPDGLVLTQPWPAGPRDNRRDQVVYYQYTADRARRTLRGIDEQVAKAERAVVGKILVKRNRFVTLTGADKAINRRLETKARTLAGWKGYSTYPSIYDSPGRALLALRGIPRNTVPSTIVLDRQHRIAAIFLQPVRV